MKRIASVMYLYEGKENEYKKRHDELWPEMKNALKDHGASNYSIFLEPKTLQLFAYVEVENEEVYQQISSTEVCQKWWSHMKPLMKTNPDNSPISNSLAEVFHLS